MNWDRIEGDWQQLKAKIREKWGKLTDNDLEVIRGKRDALIGALKSRYGFEKDRASTEVDNYVATLEHKKDPPRDSHP
jgi:uncharacterized protein YjbJ (UPF0337 family)